MGTGWRRAREALGLRVCVFAPLDRDEKDANTKGNPKTSTTATSSSPSRLRRSIRFSRSNCAICLESMKPGQGHALFTAECSHTFHFPCIASNAQHGNLICPVCRAQWNEVPWQGPSSKTRHKSSGSPHGRISQSQPLRGDLSLERERRLEPVPENVQEASYSTPLEPVVFDDDEPLDNVARDEVDNEPEESRGLLVTTQAEVRAVASSEQRESFTVLIHVKGPAAIKQQQERRLLDVLDSSGSLLDASCRAPLDLVTILDVSGSMSGTKLSLLKRAMGFVIRSLSPADRLSVVAFASTARRVLPLRRMVEDGRKAAMKAVDALECTGGTNILEGLRKGEKVLNERRQRNPVASIMLLSDGQDTYRMSRGGGGGGGGGGERSHRVPQRFLSFPPCQDQVTGNDSFVASHGRTDATRYGHIQIPVHAFGFGQDHDATTMHSISEESGGTFSFIQAEGLVQDAFAQCIGGLLSVVVQDLQIFVSIGTEGVKLKTIHAGSYQSTISNAGNKAIITLGDLYAEEDRDILLDVRLPKCYTGSETKIFQVHCTYRDPVTQQTVKIAEQELVIIRPERVEREKIDTISVEVEKQRNRLRTARAITEARTMADGGNMLGAQRVLEMAREHLLASEALKRGDRLSRALEKELAEIQMRMTNRYIYESCGRAYLLAAQSSHFRQRATTRGIRQDRRNHHLHNQGEQDYETPSMVDMVLRSQSIIDGATLTTERRPI